MKHLSPPKKPRLRSRRRGRRGDRGGASGGAGLFAAQAATVADRGSQQCHGFWGYVELFADRWKIIPVDVSGKETRI